MTLYTTVEQQMKDDEVLLKKQLEAEHERAALMNQQERSTQEKLLKTLINDVVSERAYLSTYHMKQDVYFKGISQDNEVIESAYQSALVKLLETDTFKNQIKKFVSGIDADTEVVISGDHAEKIEKAIHHAGHKKTEIKKLDGLGIASYGQGSEHGEFSLAEFLVDIKKMTIPFVSEFVRKNG